MELVIRSSSCIFFFQQETATELRISDWSSDVCSSDLSTYGAPRVHAALQQRGIRVARKRVARLMKAAGLQARAWRRNRNRAAVKRFFGELPNRQLNITTSHTDQVWVGDVTYLKVAGRWHYLAIVLDKHTRRLLGWRLGRQSDIALTMAALNQAVVRRRDRQSKRMNS